MSTVELKPHAPRFVREAKPVIDRVWSARLVTTRRVGRLRESEVRALRDTCEHSPHDAIASRPEKAERVRRGQPGVLEEIAAKRSPRARQSCLDDGLADAERLRDFVGSHPFELPEHKNFARAIRQAIDRRFEQGT